MKGMKVSRLTPEAYKSSGATCRSDVNRCEGVDCRCCSARLEVFPHLEKRASPEDHPEVHELMLHPLKVEYVQFIPPHCELMKTQKNPENSYICCATGSEPARPPGLTFQPNIFHSPPPPTRPRYIGGGDYHTSSSEVCLHEGLVARKPSTPALTWRSFKLHQTGPGNPLKHLGFHGKQTVELFLF